jgi:hypothetical protein
MMETGGIDVFTTARPNSFEIGTRKETWGQCYYFALVFM